MLIFKTRWFYKWAAKEGIADDALLAAVDELNAGLLDADLGGHVIKSALDCGAVASAAVFVYW